MSSIIFFNEKKFKKKKMEFVLLQFGSGSTFTFKDLWIQIDKKVSTDCYAILVFMYVQCALYV